MPVPQYEQLYPTVCTALWTVSILSTGVTDWLSAVPLALLLPSASPSIPGRVRSSAKCTLLSLDCGVISS